MNNLQLFYRSKFSKRFATSKGISLVEVMVSCVVFSILAMILFSVLRYCLLCWRGIEDRASIQAEMRKVQHTTSALIRSTSFSSVLLHDEDYRKTLAFKTYLDDDGKLVNDEEGVPQSQGYVIFTLVRPSDDPCTHTSSAGSADTRCHHKILLRIDLTNNANDLELVKSDAEPEQILANYIPRIVSGGKTGLSGRQVTVEDYKNSISGSGNPDYVKRVMIVGRNLLSFDPEVVDSPVPEIKLTVRGYRIMESGALATANEHESEDLTKTRFAVQMTSSIIPMNE
jgi:hypothetical protein